MKKHEGLRYNEGKLRYDLIHPKSQEGLVKVLTMGAGKYQDRNWEKGMAWSNVLASMKRHIAAIERGEDYDKESGELHINHVQCNAHFLSAYYSIYPEGDDRPKKFLIKKRIGLDIDEVIADFVGAWMKRFNINEDRPESYEHWMFSDERWDEVRNDKDFWMGVKPLIDPSELGFEPSIYITKRVCDPEITREWLEINNFPKAKIIHVQRGKTKVDACKSANLDVFVDDKFDTFVDLNNAGIFCYLMDKPHNNRYNVGHMRIKSLKEII